MTPTAIVQARDNTGMADRHPGDFLLDRFFPDADRETREAAREEFQSFLKTLLEVTTAIAERECAEPDSPKSDRRRRIPSLP
jgi:hypothetical protein